MRRVIIENRHGIYSITGSGKTAQGATLDAALENAGIDVMLFDRPAAVEIIEKLMGDGPEQPGQIGTGVQSA